MKKLLIPILTLCLFACNSEEQEKTKDAPGAIDHSTQHPNGVTNGSVMSRDTAASVLIHSKLSNRQSSQHIFTAYFGTVLGV